MTTTSDLTHDPGRQGSVLDAALAELIATGVGSFTVDGVAARAGMSGDSIRQVWPNAPELLNAALVHFGERQLPVPDTGEFRDDLLAYAKSYAELLNSPLGRRLVHAVIVRPRDWDLSPTRPALLEKRYLNPSVMVDRAVERGECLPDTDAVRLIDMIGIGLSLPILFYDRLIQDEDCDFVVDALLDGISPRR